MFVRTFEATVSTIVIETLENFEVTFLVSVQTLLSLIVSLISFYHLVSN
ncbi:hypothetical protein BN424_2659 [Carnobacterium maltaromaticum LMA28]|uniref:Uncharacterized protein n=1 Tax=Carnobacterium maltaromaticum LMA28 TaxID=1234679 RepID=K8EJQ9_CARML|nr:hypothetical protein BN424_2659 [Carnobacterium maltaromaticum LMA28]